MKKLLLSLVLAALAIASTQAATVTALINTNAGGAVLVTNPCTVTKLTFYNTNETGAALVYLYDNNTQVYTYTYGAYTNVTQYVTNIPSSYVDTAGVTNYMTNKYIMTAYSTAAGATAALPARATLIIPANESFVIPTSLLFGKGVILSNALAGVTLVMDYVPNR